LLLIKSHLWLKNYKQESPARSAQPPIPKGWVIAEIAGQRITGLSDYSHVTNGLKPGEKVVFKLIHPTTKETTLSIVEVGCRESTLKEIRELRRAEGLSLQTYEEVLTQYTLKQQSNSLQILA